MTSREPGAVCKVAPNAWHTLLYDPQSYVHSSRLPSVPSMPADSAASPAWRRAVNDALLAGYGLSTEIAPPRAGSVAAACVAQWRDLPDVAWLMGASCQRQALCAQARLLQLPSWVRSFAALPLSLAPGLVAAVAAAPVDRPAVWHGVACLKAWRPFMDDALWRRLTLMFPATLPAAQLVAYPADARLMLFALQHAKRASIRTARQAGWRCPDQGA